MISPRMALRLVAKHCDVLGAEEISIGSSLGRVLADNVRAPIPLPVFDNSAMDGFALLTRATRQATRRHPVRLKIVGTVYAGDMTERSLERDEACGIMTGAPLPDGADTVIPIEKAHVEGSVLRVVQPVERYRHVRRRGEEIKRGATVLKKGQIIHPGMVGCLATLGQARVRVIRRPRVTVITTGDEAVQPGVELLHGQIYDSNSHMIAAMLREMGIEPVRVRRIRDRRAPLERAVDTALHDSDVLVIVGGVSVGERDFVRSVLDRKGVEQVFWRVRQKPGKPVYFGKRGGRLVFGLPGNPASGFTCFYIYVYPALRWMSGIHDAALPEKVLPLGGSVRADAKRWMFLKGKATAKPTSAVTELPRQGSHMITSLSEADSMILIPATGKKIARGSKVVTYQLPFSKGKSR